MGITFWHLYTAWALLLATLLIVRLFKGPRCAHAWELVDKLEFGSALAHMHKSAGLNFSGVGMSPWYWDKLSRQKTVVVLRCPKCGDPLVKEFTS